MDEPAQLITVETSLRMTWTDPRLKVMVPRNFPTNYVLFRSDVTRYIWFPDVYIDGIQSLRQPAYKARLTFLCIRFSEHPYPLQTIRGKFIYFFFGPLGIGYRHPPDYES